MSKTLRRRTGQTSSSSKDFIVICLLFHCSCLGSPTDKASRVAFEEILVSLNFEENVRK